MRYKVMAIRDRAADVYGQPFFMATVAMGIRAFTDEVNRGDTNSNICKHPDDFDLYLLGDFDDGSGVFECSAPTQLAVGKDCVKG